MLSKKICLVGRFAVGKTSLVDRFVKNHFSEKYQTTVGVSIASKVMNKNIKFIIWDIAGYESEGHYKPYLRGTHGLIWVVDATEPESIKTIKTIQHSSPELKNIPAICFINKSDLKDQIKLGSKEQQELSELIDQYIWTSAKTGENVEQGFEILCEKLL